MKMHLTKTFLTLSILAMFYFHANAQTFVPDKNGYVDEPAFLKFIKQHNFQLVAAFDTISKKPLTIAANVMQSGIWQKLDVHGNITPIKHDFTPVPYSSSVDVPIGISSDDDMMKETGYNIVNINGKSGTVNKKTNQPGLPTIYDGLSILSGGLVEIRIGEKKGIAKYDGTIIQAPQYDEVQLTYFESRDPKGSRRIIVKKDGKTGLLSASGATILQPRYDRIGSCDYCVVKGFMLKVNVDKKEGLVDSTGKIIVEPTYTLISPLSFHGLFTISTGEIPNLKYGVADSTGKVLIEPQFTEIKYLHKENLLQVNTSTRANPQYGITSANGKIVIAPAYQQIIASENGAFLVQQNGKYGIINQHGFILLKPEYTKLGIHSGYVIATDDNRKAGLLTMKGIQILPYDYDALYVKNDYVVFNKAGKWGILTTTGKPVCMLDYDYVLPGEAFISVKKNGKEGIIDYANKIIFPLIYDRILGTGQSKGILVVEVDQKRYEVDRYGNEISYQINP